MTRRKPLAERFRGGKARVRPELMPPTEIYRLREAAASGLRDKVWATQLGQMNLRQQISDTQFAAGLRWSTLVAEYSVACQVPRAPRSAKPDPDGGTPVDVDSPAGVREARRHVKSVESYLAGRKLLQRMGGAAEDVVRDVCEMDLHPGGPFRQMALKQALTALGALWGGK